MLPVRPFDAAVVVQAPPDAHVYQLGAAGSATVWTGHVIDCDFLKYWWGKRTADTQYGVVVDDPEYYSGGAGWLSCDGAVCGPIQARLAVGFR